MQAKTDGPESTPSIHAGKKAVFAVLTAVLILGLSEIGLRLMGFEYGTHPRYLSFHQDKYLFSEGDPAFERDEELFWRFIPGNPSLGINEQGFRGPDFIAKKEPGIRRILCFGDSVTYGLKEPSSYTLMLEELLNRPGERSTVEVLNFGVPGYSSFQGVRLLERSLKMYAPDLITIMFGWNDHWLCRRLPDKEQKPSPERYRIADRIRLYQFLQYLLNAFRMDSSAPATGPDSFRVSIEDYKANLRRAVSSAQG
ncbi:MAG: SGNH/GDSL hydrolase family protein, partial [Planctomycetota bacterium]